MMNKTLSPLFALCLFIFSLAVFAGAISEAETAIKSGDYAHALELFKPLAESDNPEAMLGMGRLYRNGWGVGKNPDTAISWFGKAANLWNEKARQGDPRAWASLGIMFNKGLGYKRDRSKAQEYFKYAFDQAQPRAFSGDLESQYLLGTLYSSGKGVPKDIYAGVDWLTKAGEGGHQTAMKLLIRIFDCGCRGLPKDDAKVEYWRARLVAQ